MSTSWTEEDLEKLEKAMAEGALRVKYKDKEVEYRSYNDMNKLRDQMRSALGLKTSRTVRVSAKHDKGL